MPERFTLDNHPRKAEGPNADDASPSLLTDWVITDNEPEPGYQEQAPYAHFIKSYEQARKATDKMNRNHDLRDKWYWVREHTQTVYV